MNVIVDIPAFHDDETPLGYLSRIACSFGLNLAAFCSVKGVNRLSVARGEPEALFKAVGQWQADLGSISRNAIVRVEHARFRVRSDHNLFTDFEWASDRYCPHCVLDDIREGKGYWATRPYQRLSWQHPFVGGCERHQIRFATPREHSKLDRTGDFARFVEAGKAEIERAAQSAPHRELLECEKYFLHRLYAEDKGTHYLDSYQTYVAGSLCLVFGHHALKARPGPSGLRDYSSIATMNAGYKLLSGGEEAMRDFFDNMPRPHNGAMRVKSVMYGRIYVLADEKKTDINYHRFVEFLRADGIARLALGPGDYFLGDVTERNFHSVTSAAKTYGLDTRRVKRLLVRAGVITDSTTGFSDLDLIFTASQARDFLTQLDSAISYDKASKKTGLAISTITDFVKRGVLEPFGLERKHSISKHSLTSLLDRLLNGQAQSRVTQGYVTVDQARRMLQATERDLLLLVLDGRVETRLGYGETIDALHVHLAQCRRLIAAAPDKDVKPQRWVIRRLRTGKKTVCHLDEINILPSVPGLNKQSRLWEKTAVEAFAREYVSLWELQTIFGSSLKSIKLRLSAAGILPRVSAEGGGATFYARSEIPGLQA